MQFNLNSVTILVKTFKRPSALLALLNSIRESYPEIPILIADDSGVSEKQHTYRLLSEFKNTRYFAMPLDSGLSAGRNLLVSQAETPLVMMLDDDTIFQADTRIEWAIEILNRFPYIDLVVGLYKPELFYGSLVIENNQLVRDLCVCRDIRGGCPIFDFLPNMFVAKTEKIREVRWDPELKIQEHMDFFWRARGTITSTYLPYFGALNSHAREDTDYHAYRDRFDHYQRLQAQKIGVSKIISRNNEPTYLHEAIDPVFVSPMI